MCALDALADDDVNRFPRMQLGIRLRILRNNCTNQGGLRIDGCGFHKEDLVWQQRAAQGVNVLPRIVFHQKQRRLLFRRHAPSSGGGGHNQMLRSIVIRVLTGFGLLRDDGAGHEVVAFLRFDFDGIRVKAGVFHFSNGVF